METLESVQAKENPTTSQPEPTSAGIGGGRNAERKARYKAMKKAKR